MRALPLTIAVLVSPCMAMQATGASEDACERVFATVDLNSDGSLDAAEGLRYFAAMRVIDAAAGVLQLVAPQS